MAGIATGQQLTLRYDGHAFVPSEPLNDEFKTGDEFVATVVRVDDVSSEQRARGEKTWQKLKSTFGMWQAPEGFNWDFDRDDLYRDAT